MYIEKPPPSKDAQRMRSKNNIDFSCAFVESTNRLHTAGVVRAPNTNYTDTTLVFPAQRTTAFESCVRAIILLFDTSK